MSVIKYQIFQTNNGGAGDLGWLTTCGLLAAVIFTGRAMGHLTESCLLVIGAFAFLRGVLPFFTCKHQLVADVDQCSIEHDDLMSASCDQSELLLAQDDSGAGSVHRLAIVLTRSSGRSTKEEATESFFACFDENWDTRIEGIRDVANYCPTFGIAGTMLGLFDIAQVLESNNGSGGVGAAIATMALTTLAGGACFVLLSGLTRYLSNAVARHRKDLKYVSAMFLRESEQPSRRSRSSNIFSRSELHDENPS